MWGAGPADATANWPVRASAARFRTGRASAGPPPRPAAPALRPQPRWSQRRRPGLRRAWPLSRQDPSLQDRKGVLSGKRGSVRLDLGGRRFIKKKNVIIKDNKN